MSANPTLTITETILSGTDLSSQPITIASDLGSAADPVTTPGTYIIQFTMQVSGLDDGQTIANFLIDVPGYRRTDSPLSSPQGGGWWSVCNPSVDVYTTDGTADNVENFFHDETAVNGYQFFGFSSETAAYCEPGQAVVSPCESAAAESDDTWGYPVINGASTEVVILGTEKLKWDGTADAAFTVAQPCSDDPTFHTLSTWDNNATITTDQFGQPIGSGAPQATAWENDQYTFTANTITFGGPQDQQTQQTPQQQQENQTQTTAQTTQATTFNQTAPQLNTQSTTPSGQPSETPTISINGQILTGGNVSYDVCDTALRQVDANIPGPSAQA